MGTVSRAHRCLRQQGQRLGADVGVGAVIAQAALGAAVGMHQEFGAQVRACQHRSQRHQARCAHGLEECRADGIAGKAHKGST